MARIITLTVLAAMPEDGSAMTISALAGATSLGRHRISRCFTDVLVIRGLARPARPGGYELTAAGIEAKRAGRPVSGPPVGRKKIDIHRNRDDTYRARVWKALRALNKATVPELCQLAQSDDEEAHDHKKAQVHRYLGALIKVGYVTRLRQREQGTAPGSPGFMRYLLLPEGNTGPKAPAMRGHRHELYDPNTGKTYSLDTGDEVAP